MSSSSFAERGRGQRGRARLSIALAAVAVVAALLPAEARQAVPADPVTLEVEGAPLSDLSTSGLQLTPAFSPSATDYVLRCRPGVNTVGITLTGASGGTLRLGSLSGPSVSSSVALVENQALVIEAPGPGEGTTASYWIRCLPSDFPALAVTRPGNPPPGWYLTGNIRSMGGGGTYAMILDSNGTPVWYQRTSGSGAIDVTPVAKNVAAWASNPGPGFGTDPNSAFDLFNFSTEETSRLRTSTRPLDFHELLALPDGNYLLIATPLRPGLDLRALGFGRDQTIVDCVVEEVTAGGTPAWRWRASDHMSVGESVHPDPVVVNRQRAYDVFHCNSIDRDPQTGDLLLSMRGTDAVYRLNRATGQVLWKLGGNSVVRKGEQHFIVKNDPQRSFYGQHDARFQPNNGISLFDNHTWHVGAARGVEYHIDAKAGTASLAWEYRNPDDGHSNATGAFRRYAQGSDNLIAWGFKPNTLFTEVDADGKVLLNVALPNGDWAYRAVKVPTDEFDIDLLHRTAGARAASFPPAPRLLSVGAETVGRGDRASVEIAGTGLAGASAVRFGSADASSFSVASDGLIRAVAPPGSGQVRVTVATPGGTSSTRDTNMLEGSDSTFATGIGSWQPNVNAAVTLSRGIVRSRPFSLEVKPVTGGFCSALTSQYQVIGNAAVTGEIWTRLRLGVGQARSALVFYDDLGSVLWISQGHFRRVTNRWARLTITGTSPAGAASVALAMDGFRCESPLYVDDASLSGSSRFDYRRSALNVASVGPDSGSEKGGTIVTITGGGLTKATSVRFGTKPATSFTLLSDTSITAVAPAGSGAVDVTVGTPTGISRTNAPNLLAPSDATFESGPGSWVGNVNATAVSSRNARTGSYSLESKPTKAGFQSVVSGAYPAAGRAVYSLRLWINTPEATQHARPFMVFYGPAGDILTIEQGRAYKKTSRSAWTSLSLTARSPQGVVAVAVGVDDVDGGSVFVDDVSLSGSTRFTYR
jgi:Arylsulfotransferase (ASST)/IPT/TIG domain